ncbi:monosaccharide ABC transporter membrane protein (CUT2 family) [Halanaerobium saccharolyticum]|uniref:Monosaccharide ABC transporter membrane protein (CUT2 family) n=1 Tax=Halanaerobium saccharolyticum TaxID=43595 RepID=A0A4R6LJJ0_9FIRM|nr:ABC transporter permease [Halanaerobium saccharolyticum]TDO83416.1 monosaccharide ABC transporter membrane protein (CUT2 family) [Halanaerobium saccharolyticum]
MADNNPQKGNLDNESQISPGTKFKELLRKKEFGVFLALLLIGLFFTIMTDRFLTVGNLMNVLRQTAVLGIITVGMTMLITSQEFDLSVGSIYALTPIIAGLLVRDFGLNIWVAVIITAGVAVIAGLINGFITVKIGIPSFITTLGTMMFFRGLTLILSDGWPIAGLPDSAFYSIVGGQFFSIPMQSIWFIIIVLIGYVVFERSKFGYKIFATGGNKEAAQLSGINTDKIKMICFILTALTATFAGLTDLGYLGSVSPTQGSGLELEVIAASVIGGTALFGGSGSIVGAFLGASIMGVVRNGLTLIGTSAYFKQALIGLVIVLAVIVNVKYTSNSE